MAPSTCSNNTASTPQIDQHKRSPIIHPGSTRQNQMETVLVGGCVLIRLGLIGRGSISIEPLVSEHKEISCSPLLKWRDDPNLHQHTQHVDEMPSLDDLPIGDPIHHDRVFGPRHSSGWDGAQGS